MMYAQETSSIQSQEGRNTPSWANPKSLRQQWNEACLQVGLPSLTLNTCAKIMAILMHYGNNEAMVLSPHFRADCEYVQKRYHIQGGKTPDLEFIEEFQPIEKELRDLEQPPGWAKHLMKNMYNIEI